MSAKTVMLEQAIAQLQRERQVLKAAHHEKREVLQEAANMNMFHGDEVDMGAALTAARAARMRRPKSAASYFYPMSDWQAEPPPWLSQAGVNPVHRSASRDQFQRPPPAALKRPPPCMPVLNRAPFSSADAVDAPFPKSSHTTHFADRGALAHRPRTCKPKVNPAPYQSTDAPDGLNRSTSNDAFSERVYGVNATRQPCQPPRNPPPFWSDDAGGFLQRSTSTDTFQSFMKPRMRESCRPKGSNRPPFSSADVYGSGEVCSTAKAAFTHGHGVVTQRRKPFQPPRNPPPY